MTSIKSFDCNPPVMYGKLSNPDSNQDLRSRIERIGIELIEVTSKSLDSADSQVQYKRSPGWAKEIERPVTAAPLGQIPTSYAATTLNTENTDFRWQEV